MKVCWVREDCRSKVLIHLQTRRSISNTNNNCEHYFPFVPFSFSLLVYVGQSKQMTYLRHVNISIWLLKTLGLAILFWLFLYLDTFVCAFIFVILCFAFPMACTITIVT
ncbi:hypothetical protein S83_002534 [Arachis hypogaea]